MFIRKPQSKASKNIRKLVHGVGINDAPYIIGYKDKEGKTIKCPYYSVWAGMVERCYSPKLHMRKPSYKGASMDPSWLKFSNFLNWMEKQDWEGKTLDKDILAPGLKHYGPDTCLFISQALNNLLCLREAKRGDYPLGVSRTVINKCEYFSAQCSFHGVQKRLGYFKTPELAAIAYNTAKADYIKELASKEKNPIVKQALLNMG